jgi:hypothetical protein
MLSSFHSEAKLAKIKATVRRDGMKGRTILGVVSDALVVSCLPSSLDFLTHLYPLSQAISSGVRVLHQEMRTPKGFQPVS